MSREAILNSIAARLAAFPDSPPIRWPNSGAPAIDRPRLDVSISWGPNDNIGQSGERWARALLQIAVVAEQHTGPMEAHRIVDRLQEWWPHGMQVAPGWVEGRLRVSSVFADPDAPEYRVNTLLVIAWADL